MMKRCLLKEKIFGSTVLTALALILEILPYGAILRFADPEGEPWVRSYSYFSLTPFGYGNFGPFLTAIASCLLLVLLLYRMIWKGGAKNLLALRLAAALSVFLSVWPVFLGLSYLSLTGFFISLTLCATFLLLMLSSD